MVQTTESNHLTLQGLLVLALAIQIAIAQTAVPLKHHCGEETLKESISAMPADCITE